MQYKITTLSGGEQYFAGSESNIVKAIAHAVDMCETEISESKHKKKEHRVYVRSVHPTDCLAPAGAIAEVSFSFNTVARSNKSYWISEEV